MNSFGVYKIIAEKKLVVQFYKGNIVKDNIIHLQKLICNELNYNPTFDVVADFREAELLSNTNDVVDFVDFMKNHAKNQGKRKSAYLTSKPNHVALTTLFLMQIENMPIQPNIFSTSIALVNWLNSEDVDDKFLSLIIKELKENVKIFNSEQI